MHRSLRDGSQAPCGCCCLIQSNASPASHASSTVPLSSIRSGSQVSSCDEETILIEGIEQGLKVGYLPDSCLAHKPCRTIARCGLWLCHWRGPAWGIRCTHPARGRVKPDRGWSA